MKKKIFVNLLLMVVVLSSYIGFLFFISSEGIKNPNAMPKHGAIDAEIVSQFSNNQNAKIEEMKFNKSLIEIR